MYSIYLIVSYIYIYIHNLDSHMVTYWNMNVIYIYTCFGDTKTSVLKPTSMDNSCVIDKNTSNVIKVPCYVTTTMIAMVAEMSTLAM